MTQIINRGQICHVIGIDNGRADSRQDKTIPPGSRRLVSPSSSADRPWTHNSQPSEQTVLEPDAAMGVHAVSGVLVRSEHPPRRSGTSLFPDQQGNPNYPYRLRPALP